MRELARNVMTVQTRPLSGRTIRPAPASVMQRTLEAMLSRGLIPTCDESGALFHLANGARRLSRQQWL